MAVRRQKICALFLAASLTVSLAVPAFAEDTQDILSSGDAAGTFSENQTTAFAKSQEEFFGISEDCTEISENQTEKEPARFSVNRELNEQSRLVSVLLEWPKENRGYRWIADTRQWYCVNGSFKESGVYVLGETEDTAPLLWNLSVSGSQASAVSGYRWNADSQAYEYYLDEADANEMEGIFPDLPSILYVGAKGDISRHSGLQTIDGKTCYLNDDGSLLKNAEKDIDGITYYFDENGNLTKSYQRVLPGWVKKSGKYYWQLEDGSFFQEGGLQTLDGKSYFLDEKSGFRKTGWQTIGKKSYYFHTKTGVMKTGILNLNGKRYVLNTKGQRVKKGWATIGSHTYYVDPKTGYAVVGWRTIKGKRYYFIKAANGRLAKGWRKIDGAKYYLHPKTGVMKTGLLKLSGKQYYLGKDGKLVTNKKIFAVGKRYYRISKKGVLSELNDSEAQILAKLKLEQIGWNLKNAFQWSAGIFYMDTSNAPPMGYTFAEYNAVCGFQNNSGNSQVMAATFYYMAQALGYDVHMVRGYVPLATGGMRPHGWCEIVRNQKTYVFDPGFARETGQNGYQLTYGASGVWSYTGGYRIN